MRLMREFLRKCRGVLGIGVTWAVAWGAIFAGLTLLIGLFDPDSIDPGEGPFAVARIGAIFGFVSGVCFGLVLSLTEGRKTIRNLSLRRVALWGMLGTAVFPLLTPVHNSMLVILCPIGAALAAGSVAVAKKADLGASSEPPRLPRD
jgi:hypothetical protein